MLLIGMKRIVGNNKSGLPNDSRTNLPEQVVAQIQAGNHKLRNIFIAENQQFVAAFAGQFYKRHINPAIDDEFTIALSAFDEAINLYNSQMNWSFLDFAKSVMQKRMTEYKSTGADFFVESFSQGKSYDKQSGIEERQSEIADLREVLHDFGIEFEDLVAESPEDEELCFELLTAAKELGANAELMRQLLKTRKLPIKELAVRSGISRKILGQHKNYVTIIAILGHGPFPNLRTYLELVSTRERRGKL
ncbi:RNA polymerase subunit sigma [Paenibacillus albiflavus]|nr:RNA polymerase subunit sigma [Paenibacillus albiflavus]